MKSKLLSLIIITLALSGSSLPAANIAFVSYHSADNTPNAAATTAGFTNAPDKGYTQLLAANGHTVTRFLTTDNIDTQPALQAALATNDLIIISRSAPSGHYQAVGEVGAWSGIAKPIMVLSG